MSAQLDAALSYVALTDRPVFPVKPDKKPYTAHGFHDATADETAIRAWWDRWPTAGIATPTGDGLFVLDVDVPAALAALEAEHEPLPATVEVVTPRPGRHLYFGGGDVTNRTGVVPGIDVRGAGGYVLVPPSPHPNGVYEWRTAPDEISVATAPAWLLEILKPPTGQNGHAPPVGNEIPDSERNSTLASLAGTMRRRGFDEPAIAAALLVTNRTRCRPPLTDDDVRKIAHSVARYKPAADGTLEELSKLLGLDTVGRGIDVVRLFGRGSNAIAHITLDDGERIVLDPLGKFTTCSKMNTEMALRVGVPLALKLPELMRVLVLLSRLSEQYESVEMDDRAAELGADYLRWAATGDVDMADQTSRWKAFCHLERCTTENIVLVDSKTGVRYVRIGWFATFVRQHAGVADAVLRAMPALGWSKRGAEGQIKATQPGFKETHRLRFFEIPKGWGE